MSDAITHECGVALVRLRKPLTYYRQRYDDPAWGLRKLYLLMEKQHNRGQDGAGIATVRFDIPPGEPFMERMRSVKRNPVERLFDAAMEPLLAIDDETMASLDDLGLKRRARFLGEVYLGHLRYGTFGGRTQEACHPFLRRDIVASRNLALAGNFNMTNSPELFARLVDYGLHPVGDSDTQVVLEKIGYSLDREHDLIASSVGPESFRQLEGRALMAETERQLDIVRVLRRASEQWDGGYVLAGLLGSGDAFVCRDPAGVRPCFHYSNDEIVAVASERAALVTVLDVQPNDVQEIPPAHALVMRRNGEVDVRAFTEPLPKRHCTFERIYFSRGNDRDIYAERKALGRQLAPRVLDAIDGDLARTVFSFIPNTAEIAYIGLTEEVERLVRTQLADDAWTKAQNGTLDENTIRRLAHATVRREKSAHKDQRLRTFITHDRKRRDLVSHIYDITPGTVGEGDTLVVVDDSIVRGTTLRDSIVTMLARLRPARMVIVSSAPPIAYPDCYGIDMSQLGRFIAFEAAISLLHERNDEALLEEVEARCREQAHLPPTRMVNHVRSIYERFTLGEIEARVAQLIRSRDLDWAGSISVIYQSVEGLRAAMPEFRGDWYFTGDYPTPGGYKVLNSAFLKWRSRDDGRAYST